MNERQFGRASMIPEGFPMLRPASNGRYYYGEDPINARGERTPAPTIDNQHAEDLVCAELERFVCKKFAGITVGSGLGEYSYAITTHAGQLITRRGFSTKIDALINAGDAAKRS